MSVEDEAQSCGLKRQGITHRAVRNRIPRGRIDKCWRFNKTDLDGLTNTNGSIAHESSIPKHEAARTEGTDAYLFLNWFTNTKLRRKDSMMLISLGSSGAPLRVAAPYAPTSAM